MKKRLKIGTKVRTKRYKRSLMKSWLGVEGTVVGKIKSLGKTMWRVKACSKDGLTKALAWYAEELEVIKPLKLKKFSAWK